MTSNTANLAVIEFIRDYTNDELGEPRIYQISDGGVRTSKPVGVSNGKSINFFLVETVNRLEGVREATTGVGGTSKKK